MCACVCINPPRASRHNKTGSSTSKCDASATGQRGSKEVRTGNCYCASGSVCKATGGDNCDLSTEWHPDSCQSCKCVKASSLRTCSSDKIAKWLDCKSHCTKRGFGNAVRYGPYVSHTTFTHTSIKLPLRVYIQCLITVTFDGVLAHDGSSE